MPSKAATAKSKPSPKSESSIPAEKITLPNGLTLITLEDHSAPVTSVQTWAKTGSIHETDHMGAGLSHILEHMLFKGTKKRGVADISKQVEALGGDINAYTTWDRTVYHIDIPSDGGSPGTSKGTEMAIDILADAMMNSTLPPKEYLLEQKVILREMAMGRDDPDRQAFETFASTVYSIHPSRYPVIGYEEIYVALKQEEVMHYYKERYVPNNMIFVVVGDIQTAKVQEQVKKLTEDWQRKSLPPFFIPDEPPQIGPRTTIEESKTAAQQSRVYVGYPTCDFRHPDAAALEILSIIAGQGFSSRFYQSLREQQKLVHEVDVWSQTPSWRGMLAVNAITDPEKAEPARKAIITELEKFKKDRVSDDELSKALKIVKSRHLGSRKTMSGQAADIASSEMLTGDPAFSDKYLEKLMAVTAKDIQHVAQVYFTPDTLNVAILNPKGTSKASKNAVQKEEDFPIQKNELSNGLTLLTKEEHRLPFVEFRLVMKSGLLFENEKNNGISRMTARLLLKGTKKRSAEQIVSEIESVGGSISTYSGANSMGISIEVLKSDTSLAFEILSDIIRESTFDEKALAREKEAQIADIRQEKEEPVNIAMQNARAKLFGSHPYGMPNLGKEDKVAAFTSSQIRSFWKEIAAPSNMVLAVFGDVQPKEIQKMTEKSLGSLPKQSLTRPATAKGDLKKSERIIDKQDKEQAVVVIAFPGIDLKNKERPQIEVMNAALTGMGSRLFLRLRDQLALCYYVGVNEMIGLDPGFIYFYIGTEPAKAAEAEKEILSEIDKLRSGGISQEELLKAQNTLLGERKMRKQNVGELAMSAAMDELYNLGFDYTEKLTALYQKVTTAQVQEAAKKYLSQSNIISVVQPEKK